MLTDGFALVVSVSPITGFHKYLNPPVASSCVIGCEQSISCSFRSRTTGRSFTMALTWKVLLYCRHVESATTTVYWLDRTGVIFGLAAVRSLNPVAGVH